MSNDEQSKGKNLAIDLKATSASPTEPAFIARPNGAPVYYGFTVLEDVRVEEFTFGTAGTPLRCSQSHVDWVRTDSRPKATGSRTPIRALPVDVEQTHQDGQVKKH